MLTREHTRSRSRTRRLGPPQEPGGDGGAATTRGRGHVPVRSRRERRGTGSTDGRWNAGRGESALPIRPAPAVQVPRPRPFTHFCSRVPIRRTRASEKNETTGTSSRKPAVTRLPCCKTIVSIACLDLNRLQNLKLSAASCTSWQRPPSSVGRPLCLLVRAGQCARSPP